MKTKRKERRVKLQVVKGPQNSCSRKRGCAYFTRLPYAKAA